MFYRTFGALLQQRDTSFHSTHVPAWFYFPSFFMCTKNMVSTRKSVAQRWRLEKNEKERLVDFLHPTFHSFTFLKFQSTKSDHLEVSNFKKSFRIRANAALGISGKKNQMNLRIGKNEPFSSIYGYINCDRQIQPSCTCAHVQGGVYSTLAKLV